MDEEKESSTSLQVLPQTIKIILKLIESPNSCRRIIHKRINAQSSLPCMLPILDIQLCSALRSGSISTFTAPRTDGGCRWYACLGWGACRAIRTRTVYAAVHLSVAIRARATIGARVTPSAPLSHPSPSSPSVPPHALVVLDQLVQRHVQPRCACCCHCLSLLHPP